MEDDDQFWRIPEGHSWKDAGKMLRELRPKATRSAAAGKHQGRRYGRRRRSY